MVNHGYPWLPMDSRGYPMCALSNVRENTQHRHLKRRNKVKCFTFASHFVSFHIVFIIRRPLGATRLRGASWCLSVSVFFGIDRLVLAILLFGVWQLWVSNTVNPPYSSSPRHPESILSPPQNHVSSAPTAPKNV